MVSELMNEKTSRMGRRVVQRDAQRVMKRCRRSSHPSGSAFRDEGEKAIEKGLRKFGEKA